MPACGRVHYDLLRDGSDRGALDAADSGDVLEGLDAPEGQEVADVGDLDAGESPPDSAGCLTAADCGECGTCVGGTCGVALDGQPCSVSAGLCYGGICCTGCWDGATCAAGTTIGACGTGGAA